jgi:hypothetical protein
LIGDREATQLIGAAERVAHRLAASATWIGTNCTWSVSVPTLRTDAQVIARTQLASSDLYQGAPGIALILGEIYRLCPDEKLLTCAKGGIRFAQSQSSSTRNAMPALYSGTIGVAYAAARIAAITGDEEMLDVTKRQLKLVQSSEKTGGDVISGAAGAVLGLLMIYTYTALPEALDQAVAFGMSILADAECDAHGWSWPQHSLVSMQNLCGYAHGTSGYAHALLELFARTKDSRWRFAAQRAMEYERFHSRGLNGDWPDFRSERLSSLCRTPEGLHQLRSQLIAGEVPEFATNKPMRAWCHGSPGIALTRLRAISLNVDAEECRKEVDRSLMLISQEIAGGCLHNHSLCHGLCGNVETVITARERLGWLDERLVVRTGQEVAAAVDEGKFTPGTVGGAPDHSLMLGDAGAVHFLLRVANPSTPSALFLSDWSALEANDISDTAYVVSDVQRLFAHFFRATQRFQLSPQLADALNTWGKNQPTVLTGIRTLSAVVTQYATGPDEPLREMFDLDARCLAATTRFSNYIEQYLLELGRPDVGSIDWRTSQFVLCESVELVTARQRWPEWFAGSCEVLNDGPQHYLIYRSKRSVRVTPITAPLALVVELLRVPGTLQDIQYRVLDAISCAPAEPDRIKTFVRDALTTFVGASVVQIQRSPERA